MNTNHTPFEILEDDGASANAEAEAAQFEEAQMYDDLLRLRKLNAEFLEVLEYANETFSRFMREGTPLEEYPAILKIRNAIAKSKWKQE